MDTDDIEKILKRSAALLGVMLDDLSVKRLAKASRATPRVANRLLKRARDFAQVEGVNQLEENIIEKTLELLDIDERGLEPSDRQTS